MEISRTKLDDTGQYTVTAKNDHGSISCHCTLMVDKGIRAYIAPEFYCALDAFYTFKEADEIRLTTQVEAYPTVGVTWLHNGVRLRPSRRIATTLDEDGYVELVIKEITTSDAGIYTCIASNAVGRVESGCRVVIEELEDKQIRKTPAVVCPNTP